MKIATFFALFGSAVGSTEAFLTSSRIAERKPDVMTLHMNRFQKQHEFIQPDVRLYQSSTSFVPSTANNDLYGLATKSSETSSSTSGLSKSISKLSPLFKALASSTLFMMAEILIKQVFKAKGISFPSSLAGCCAMAAALLISPFHASMYRVMEPGAKLLQKFLMVFLVPNLIVLPLCDGCGSVTEVLKIFSVIFGGFLFSLLSTSYSVCAVRKIFKPSTSIQQLQPSPTSSSASPSVATIKPPKAFSDELTHGSRVVAVVSGIAALMAHQLRSAATSPLVALSMLAATVHNFCFGARMPKKVTKVIHPLVTCTTLTWVWATVMGAATGTSFLTMIAGYRRGGVLNLATAGAGDLLTFVLGPAVVSLGVSIYERRELIRQNLKEVVTATGVSCIGGLFGTALAVRLLALASGELRLSLFPRNITSALAVAIADIVGANKALAVSFAVVTGLIGANFGASLLDFFGIKDSAARGLGIGAAAHGLGTAAFIDEKDAFPFAAIGMTLTAICGTVLVSVPVVKKLALQIALGGL
ncbi:LrgB-like family protein [Nitzschia inconspicua]|uniref:LrgB-like family protein n=1 Tax=Nitzschia inconspicua TaxID=303405 RepID=A0A9K3M2Y7_9STRA|nr:LrgB-like family protein [Nitzschia inconspicua]